MQILFNLHSTEYMTKTRYLMFKLLSCIVIFGKSSLIFNLMPVFFFFYTTFRIGVVFIHVHTWWWHLTMLDLRFEHNCQSHRQYFTHQGTATKLQYTRINSTTSNNELTLERFALNQRKVLGSDIVAQRFKVIYR